MSARPSGERVDVADRQSDTWRRSAAVVADWPNFPRVDDPLLWDFRMGLEIRGCAEVGRPDFSAVIVEERDESRWGRVPPYAWDGLCGLRWLNQVVWAAEATPDHVQWLSIFPWCGSQGDVYTIAATADWALARALVQAALPW